MAQVFRDYLQQHLPSTTVDELMACNATPLRPCLRPNTLRVGNELSAFFEECLSKLAAVPWWPPAFWYQPRYPETEFALGVGIALATRLTRPSYRP